MSLWFCRGATVRGARSWSSDGTFGRLMREVLERECVSSMELGEALRGKRSSSGYETHVSNIRAGKSSDTDRQNTDAGEYLRGRPMARILRSVESVCHTNARRYWEGMLGVLYPFGE